MNERTTLDPEKILARMKSFNRKERNAVNANALLGKAIASPSPEFIKRLKKSLPPESEARTFLCSLKPENVSSVFVAADYHLDWLAAAVHACWFDPNPEPGGGRPKGSNYICGTSIPILTGNQEDIDLVLAARDGTGADARLFLYLIEAKLDTGWTWRQLKSKLDRLSRIVPDDTRIVVSLILALPRWDTSESKSRWRDTGSGTRYRLRLTGELESRVRELITTGPNKDKPMTGGAKHICAGWTVESRDKKGGTWVEAPAYALLVPGSDSEPPLFRPTRSGCEENEYTELTFEKLHFATDDEENNSST